MCRQGDRPLSRQQANRQPDESTGGRRQAGRQAGSRHVMEARHRLKVVAPRPSLPLIIELRGCSLRARIFLLERDDWDLAPSFVPTSISSLPLQSLFFAVEDEPLKVVVNEGGSGRPLGRSVGRSLDWTPLTLRMTPSELGAKRSGSNYDRHQ